jgi:hypothetical protein
LPQYRFRVKTVGVRPVKWEDSNLGYLQMAVLRSILNINNDLWWARMDWLK